MTERQSSEERAARIAALRAARQTPDHETPVATVTTHRRNPARAARVVTVGGSTTAVLAMMAAYGLADRAEAASDTVVEPEAAALPSAGEGTIRVPSDTPVVVVVVDSAGVPIALEQMSDAQALADFLAVARRIAPLSEVPAPAAPAVVAPPPTSSTVTSPIEAATPAVVENSVPAPAPAPEPTPAPAAAPEPAPAPAPEPSPAPAPEPTAAPAPTPTPATAPAPAPASAPVELSLPTPTPAPAPAQGSSGGS